MKVLSACWTVAPISMAIACAGNVSDEPTGSLEQPIINGSAPTEGYHEAVLGLIIEYGPSEAYICSGTLIASDVVLTAAHCVEGSPTDIWVTEDDTLSWSGNLLPVVETRVHEGYDGAQLVNDLALLRIDPNSVSATPVPYLPAAAATLSSGEWVNFAGFGQDENGNAGTLLQATWTLGGVDNPCTVYDRRGARLFRSNGTCLTDPGTQSWYNQTDSTGLTMGPCFGDSGGPMFVNRDGSIYVGGVTSYGDQNCSLYGVSTRPDAFACWIDEFVLDTPGLCPDAPPPPAPECSVDADCDDADSCTDDVCSSGSCSNEDNGTCGGSGCDLGQKGDPCSSGSDCCSGKCGGKPGDKSCK